MGMKRCGRGLGAWARGLAAAFVLLACLVALPGRAQAVSVDSWDALKGAVGSSDGEPIEVNSALNAGEIIVIEDGDVTVSFAEGSSIERSGSDTTFIVRSGATLTIKGSVTVSGGTGSFVTVEAGGTLNVNGAITADGVNGSASFVDVAGTLSMGGSGAVKNWTTTNPSGDYSAINVHGADATFTMNGGEVSGNIVNAGSNSIEGGAIQLREGATFTMNGGSISGNNVYTGEKPSTVVQGGGIYANASTIKMTGGKISGNMAASGGGVYLTSGSTMTMTGGEISKNVLARRNSTGSGAGVYVGANCSFTGETADANAPVTISGNTSIDYGAGRTQAQGGGFYVRGTGSKLTLDGAVLSSNRIVTTSGQAGGGIYAYNHAEVVVKNSTIEQNSAFITDDNTDFVSYGGGLAIGNDCSLDISNSKISDNTAMEGGGFDIRGAGWAKITSCTITGNGAILGDEDYLTYEGAYIGGGMYVQSTTLTITGTPEQPTEIAKNSSLQSGGGIFIEGYRSTPVTVTMDEHVVVSENVAETTGGGVYNAAGNLTIASKVDSNTAKQAGGGIVNDSTTQQTGVVDSTATVTNNEAPEAGGVMVRNGSKFTMNGGAIADNTAGMAGGVENGGTFTMNGGDITRNKANGVTDGIGGGVANLGTFTMEGGRIFSNTAAHGANDFYNHSELEDEGGQEGGVVVDPGWDGDHNMGLDSLSDDGASSRAGEQYGTFTLIDPSGFNLGVDGWYEDEPGARYADTAEDQRVKYTIKDNDTTEQYLTLGDPVTAGVLTLEPQDMVAYTGGDSMDGDNFPEVRYRVSADNGLAEALKTTDLTLMVDGNAVALDAEAATVGEDTVIIPELGTTFTLESAATGDDEAAGVYDIAITGTVTATLSDGRLVKVVVDNDPAAKLTVRTVSNADDVADETGEAGLVAANPVTVGDSATGAQDATIATATVDAGAKFFTNGDVNMGLLGNGTNGAQVSLLFDDLLPSANGSTDDTIAALANRAGIDAETAEFKYLDLINEHDGNAWVSTDSDVTVSWPVPDGVNANEVEFTVYHFQGLHREYGGAGSPDAADQIASCTVETIPCKVVNGRVEFTLDGDAKNGCFSPFALSWGEKSTSGGVDQKPAGDKGDKNDPSMPATGDASFSAAPVLLAGCAVAGLAALAIRRR
ncbi:beta strand repeat-containing protein [Thermophilibacter sp.]|uniref:beta strand repeat-containing protein n=1 Tax=Thermophilibacter sp. TaxID=2847309 RepID=UPI003A8EEDFB